jgi:hypothetical protein
MVMIQHHHPQTIPGIVLWPLIHYVFKTGSNMTWRHNQGSDLQGNL